MNESITRLINQQYSIIKISIIKKQRIYKNGVQLYFLLDKHKNLSESTLYTIP